MPISGGNLLQSQLPSECDNLLKVLDGDNCVSIEQGTLDTQTMWWNNCLKSTFIYRYSCTIKGSELDVVLEDKLYVCMDDTVDMVYTVDMV